MSYNSDFRIQNFAVSVQANFIISRNSGFHLKSLCNSPFLVPFQFNYITIFAIILSAQKNQWTEIWAENVCPYYVVENLGPIPSVFLNELCWSIESSEILSEQKALKEDYATEDMSVLCIFRIHNSTFYPIHFQYMAVIDSVIHGLNSGCGRERIKDARENINRQ